MIRLAVACVGLLAGCATMSPKIVHDDNTDLIDREMRHEVFTEATPGAQGIVLGPDAPPLAAITYADNTNYVRNNRYNSGYGGYGYGGFIGGARTGVGGTVSYPNLPGTNGQTFGGGTAGGTPHPGSGGDFSGGTAGGSPHPGNGFGARGFGGGGRGGHR
jgi:hypothetical protein